MKIKNNSLIPLCGITAIFGGMLNGIIGTGAGIVYTFLFSLLYSGDGKYEKKDIFASCLITTLPVCAMSFSAYLKNDISILYSSLPLLPAALLGGIVGGILLDKVKNGVLIKIFALITAISGGLMIWKAL
jgi:uncharacterized membrane protein YfcA